MNQKKLNSEQEEKPILNTTLKISPVIQPWLKKRSLLSDFTQSNILPQLVISIVDKRL